MCEGRLPLPLAPKVSAARGEAWTWAGGVEYYWSREPFAHLQSECPRDFPRNSGVNVSGATYLHKYVAIVIGALGVVVLILTEVGAFVDEDRIALVRSFEINAEAPRALDSPGARQFVERYISDESARKAVKGIVVTKMITAGDVGAVDGTIRVLFDRSAPRQVCTLAEARAWSRESSWWRWAGVLLTALGVLWELALTVPEHLLSRRNP